MERQVWTYVLYILLYIYRHVFVCANASLIETHQIVITNGFSGAKHPCNPMAVAPSPGSNDPSDGVLVPCRGWRGGVSLSPQADVRRLEGELECTVQIYVYI